MKTFTTRPLRIIGSIACLLLSVLCSSATIQPTTMKQFVILFRQGPHPLTDADKARRQAAITAWAREQNAAGHKLEPRSLAPSFTRPGITVPDAAVGEWPVTALVFLDARDLDEATQVAASHPAKDYNVAMEVRPWSSPAAAKN